MAIAINVGGAILVRVDTGSAGALEDLGYTINGVQIEEVSYTADVPGDQNGGTEGPPIDVQQFGIIHRVTLELSKYDDAVLNNIRLRIRDSAAVGGFFSGDLVIARGEYFRLLLHGTRDASTTFARNYTTAIPREAISFNAGTKFSTARLAFECHYRSGVIFNSTTS